MVIFLFTDIEGSSRLWQAHRQSMAMALERHDDILRTVIAQHGGRVVEHTGDGVYAIFEEGQPLHAVLEAQRRLAREDWGDIGELRVRMGLNGRPMDKLGIDFFRKGQHAYFGPVVNLTARITNIGWGGQILLAPEVLVLCDVPAGAEIIDMGIHRLRSLPTPQHILALQHPDLPWQEFPPLRSEAHQTHNLPQPSTTFLDREHERSTIGLLLAKPECQLVNLVGPGGIGKSQLSIKVARENLTLFKHGVFFVPLAPVSSADFIVPNIADALKLSFSNRGDLKSQLLDYLRDRHLLLILDNFEHVLDGAGIITDIIQAAPHVKVLVTSRAKLNLQTEWVSEVRGMAFPERAPAGVRSTPHPPEKISTYPAVTLFLQTAQRVKPSYKLNPKDEPHIVHICQLLEGSPLGIELAATWIRFLSCQEVASEIESGLDFLSKPVQDLPARHRSLYAVFDYSWQLLTPEEQEVLTQLSVFRGGLSREAAQQVANANLLNLSLLHDKSLLQVGDVPGRYQIHELLRQFAARKLNTNPGNKAYQVQERHAQFFINLLQEQLPALKGPQQTQALETISEDIENIRAAWQWAVENAQEPLVQQGFEAIILVHEINSRFQDIDLLFKKMPLLPATNAQPNRLQGTMLLAKGIAALYLAQPEACYNYLTQSLQHLQYFDVPREWCMALFYLGGLQISLGNYDDALASLEQSLELAYYLNDEFAAIFRLSSLGVTNRLLGNYAKARTIHEESLRISHKINNQWGIAMAHYMLGFVALAQNDYTEAQEQLQTALTLFEEVGDHRGFAFTLSRLGDIAQANAQIDKALQLHKEGLKVFRSIGERRGVTLTYIQLGQITTREGLFDTARTYLLQALKLVEDVKAIPLTLEVLDAVAEFWLANNRPELTLWLWLVEQQHTANDLAPPRQEKSANAADKIIMPRSVNTSRNQSKRSEQIARLAAQLGPETISEVSQQSEDVSLTNAVTRLLAHNLQFTSVPSQSHPPQRGHLAHY